MSRGRTPRCSSCGTPVDPAECATAAAPWLCWDCAYGEHIAQLEAARDAAFTSLEIHGAAENS